LTPCSDGDHITPQDAQVYALGRSLELLNFQKSEIAVTHIQILIYYSYKRRLHNPGASAQSFVIIEFARFDGSLIFGF